VVPKAYQGANDFVGLLHVHIQLEKQNKQTPILNIDVFCVSECVFIQEIIPPGTQHSPSLWILDVLAV
jgi:hypothetical protein